MRYIVVHRATLPTGETVEKWFPSADYKQMAAHLMKLIDSDASKIGHLAVPFVLTLSAALEANLNDWLILDTLRKHGRSHHKPITDIYLRSPFAKKLRLTVAALTDNHLHLSEDSPTTKALNELIAVRNKVTHPNADVRIVDPDEEGGAFPPHPVHDLTAADCHRFQQAVDDFDVKFFQQYDKGAVEPNDVVCWSSVIPPKYGD